MLIGEVPAVGAGAEGLAALFLFMAFIVCIGLQKAWRATIGWVFVRLAQELDRVAINVGVTTLHVFGPVSAFLRSVNATVDHALAVAALKSEAGAVWLFAQVAHQLTWMASSTRALAAAIEHRLAHIGGVTVHSVTNVVKGVTRSSVLVLLHPIATTLHALQVAEHALTRRVGRLEHELATAIPHALPGVIPRVGTLEREWTAIEKRVAAVERDLAPAAIATLIGATIWKFLPDFLKCPSFRRAGSLIGCGGFELLADLLEPALLAFAVADICDFAAALGGIARELEPALAGLVVIEDALIGCHGASRAPALTLPPLDLPSGGLALPLAA